MSADRIAYREGYKYQLDRDYVILIEIRPADSVRSEFLELSRTGVLTIRDGYAWDGPSGPTVDTKNFMRGSLVHDALCQLIREGSLDRAVHRVVADRILRRICREDGMSAVRAWWVYSGVRLYARVNAADPVSDYPVIEAP